MFSVCHVTARIMMLAVVSEGDASVCVGGWVEVAELPGFEIVGGRGGVSCMTYRSFGYFSTVTKCICYLLKTVCLYK